MKKYLTLFMFSVLLNFIVYFSVQAQGATDSIRICALRVSFLPDHNGLTSGDGRFMIDTTTTDPYAIDPAPHNRLYFEDQVRAAANYFAKVSNGHVAIKGDVYPATENESFELPHDMGYYNPNTTNQAINQGLSKLFIDAVQAADQSDAHIDFSKYDLVVIFHAGIGKDVNLGYDVTPQDIPSLYLTRDFIQKSIGNQFDGVRVNNGTFRVRSGILLPETENRPGIQIALTGMFVSNIGSYLGLYDLFSPSTQRTGVGRFGLMDAGLLNMNGLVPSPPGAFSRKLLGWGETLVLQHPQNQVKLARLGSENPSGLPTMVQVPINDSEYYLLEFRGNARVKIDSLYDVFYSERNEPPSYLEILKRYYGDKIEIGESGVLLSVPNYDWGLPGAGILIWHVDERIIREKGGEQAINDDPRNMAVKIEEADGAQDIGQTYTLLEAGYQKDLGWLADFWFRNRPTYLEGFERYTNEFSSRSIPASRANRNHAFSHVVLKNFSSNKGLSMSFDYLQDMNETGFPVHLSAVDSFPGTSIAGAVEGQQGTFAFMVSQNGGIYAVGPEGKSLFGYPVRDIARIGISAKELPLALMDSNQDQRYDALFVLSGDTLYGFDLTAMTADSLLAPLFSPISFSQGLSAELISRKQWVYVSALNDSVYAVDRLGQIVSRQKRERPELPLLINSKGSVVDFPRQTTYAARVRLNDQTMATFIYSAGSGHFSFKTDAPGSQWQEWPTQFEVTGQFAVADIEGLGTYDLVFNTPSQIVALNQQGNLVSGFPIDTYLEPGQSLVGTPLIGDLDGDGTLDFLSVTSDGQLMAFNILGQSVGGFPLSAGFSLTSTPMIVQLDADPAMELLAVTRKGTVLGWQLSPKSDPSSYLWKQERIDASNNMLLEQGLVYQPVSNELMPFKRVYNYPNPNQGNFTTIRYYLTEDAAVHIKIFDTSGEAVDEFDGPGKGQMANEIAWNVSGKASGIYLCRVEAKSATRTERKIIKIMVVH